MISLRREKVLFFYKTGLEGLLEGSLCSSLLDNIPCDSVLKAYSCNQGCSRA